ncbi:hypothetical protein X474_18505 [Dethiosulfatarculus sandiegensis]|uniref:Uncharacterized protein n=1 Tax=Dethiosulfatarculus sandiegensis TaxID=1429043 RepID=A0A0D2GCG5_9BACT|nr:hypothetical protein X474_18505 [Dethiosulfatarculus sandiegensis]
MLRKPDSALNPGKSETILPTCDLPVAGSKTYASPFFRWQECTPAV